MWRRLRIGHGMPECHGCCISKYTHHSYFRHLISPPILHPCISSYRSHCCTYPSRCAVTPSNVSIPSSASTLPRRNLSGLCNCLHHSPWRRPYKVVPLLPRGLQERKVVFSDVRACRCSKIKFRRSCTHWRCRFGRGWAYQGHGGSPVQEALRCDAIYYND